MGVHKTRFTADHLYLSFDFALSFSINCGTGINHSQVTIFIDLMAWYRGSIVTDAEEIPRVVDRLLTKIRQLEEDNSKLVSRLDLKTNKLVEGEFELLLKRSKILLRQEDCTVAFAVVAKKIYGSGYLKKIKESFQVFFSKVCIIRLSLNVIISYLFLVVLIAGLVTTLNEKDCVDLDKFSTIALLLLDFCLKLAIIFYLYWYSWKFLIYLNITLLL